MRIGCIVMASGWSRRFGRNKLLEPVNGRPMIDYVFSTLEEIGIWQQEKQRTMGAGKMQRVRGEEGAGGPLPFGAQKDPLVLPESVSLDVPVVVTRWEEVGRLAAESGFRTVVHNDPDQSDTIRRGLRSPWEKNWDACIFMTGDQPLLTVESLKKLILTYIERPDFVVRLSSEFHPGNPVIFPRCYFEALRHIQGDRGGGVLIKNGTVPSGKLWMVQAEKGYELKDIDTEEELRKAERILQGNSSHGEEAPEDESAGSASI